MLSSPVQHYSAQRNTSGCQQKYSSEFCLKKIMILACYLQRLAKHSKELKKLRKFVKMPPNSEIRFFPWRWPPIAMSFVFSLFSLIMASNSTELCFFVFFLKMATNRSEICFWLLKITFIGQIFHALHSAIIHISLSQYLRSCSWFKKRNRSYHLLSGLEKKDLDYYHTYCRCRNQKLSLNIFSLITVGWRCFFF